MSLLIISLSAINTINLTHLQIRFTAVFLQELFYTESETAGLFDDEGANSKQLRQRAS